jgi:hypothetical protein
MVREDAPIVAVAAFPLSARLDGDRTRRWRLREASPVTTRSTSTTVPLSPFGTRTKSRIAWATSLGTSERLN